MQEIDFRTLLDILLKRLKWLCLATVVGALVCGVCTKLLVPKTYRSTCSFYVMNISQADSNDSIGSSSLAVSRELVNDYMDIFKTSKVLDQVSSSLLERGYRMENRDILGAISMNSNEDSALLKIFVTTTDPHLSQAIAAAVEEATPPTIKEIMMGMGTITTLDHAKPGVPMGSGTVRNALLGAVVSFVLLYGIFLVLYMMDDAVHSEQEMKVRLNLTVLGSVPSFIKENDKKGGKKRGR